MSENTLMTKQDVGLLLKQEREKQGISQRKMADLAGYHWRTIQNAESGNATMEVFKAIATVLGYEIIEDYHLIKSTN